MPPSGGIHILQRFGGKPILSSSPKTGAAYLTREYTAVRGLTFATHQAKIIRRGCGSGREDLPCQGGSDGRNRCVAFRAGCAEVDFT